MVNVLYDADPTCVAQIEERNQHLSSELHVLPYCIGGTNTTANFYIHYDPYMSSLRKVNPAYGGFYNFLGYHCTDYILSEVGQVMQECQVEIHPLDEIFASNEVSAPPPDFLSIDTQGSEYEILEGPKPSPHEYPGISGRS
jgi:FkbM family methyltransferase